MPKFVANGASLSCSKGTASGSLTVLPHQSTGDDQNLATVEDHTPMVNIPSFLMCQSTQNPTVQSATSAAGGVLTPMPCVPVVNGSWSPGSSGVTLNDQAVLTDNSTCDCQWKGTIKIDSAGTSGITDS